MKKIITIIAICLFSSIAEAQIWGGIFNPPQGTLNSSVTLSTNLTATIGGVDIRKISPVYFVDNTAHSIYTSSSSTGLAWTLSPLNEVSLLTTTINGGDMGENGILDLMHIYSQASSTNSKTLRVYFGGSIFDRIIQASTGATYRRRMGIYSRSSSSQISGPLDQGNYFGLGGVSPFVNLTVNTTISQPLIVTAQTSTEPLKSSTACSAATVTAICGSTPTVTCTVSANGYNTGEYAEVTGATPTFYNQSVALIKTALTNTVVYCATGATNTTTAQPSFSRYSPITLESCHIQILR